MKRAEVERLLLLTVNEVILDAPGAVEVFGRLGIDACCGGALPVGEACRRHGLDPEAVVRELEAAGATPSTRGAS